MTGGRLWSARCSGKSGRSVVRMEPVVDESGAAVEGPDGLMMWPVPVMETVSEEYFVEEPSGAYRFGLRPDELLWGLLASMPPAE